jgi:hypothetical protein
MSFGGHVASSSAYATSPEAPGDGSHAFAGRRPTCSLTGNYVIVTAEHQEPCDSRRSCTVLGAPGGETPSGDSTLGDPQGFANELGLRVTCSFKIGRSNFRAEARR